jgi:hypothetical protein
LVVDSKKVIAILD